MAPRPQPSPGRTYQQLRLKTLSRTEKVGFMAGVLRGTDGGGEAEGAHKCPAGSRAAQSHEREPGWGGGCDSRVTGTTGLPPTRKGGQLQIPGGLRETAGRPRRGPGWTARSRSFGSSAGSGHRGLRVPRLALARLHQQQAQS